MCEYADYHKIFLIDMENVGTMGLEGFPILKKGDELHMFIGKCTDKIRTDFLVTMQKKQIKVTYYDVIANGKNALDFQITSLLGALVSVKKKSVFYIISKDKGYDSSVAFLKEYYKNRDLSIQRVDNIAESDKTASAKIFEPPMIKELSSKEIWEFESKQLIESIIRTPPLFMDDDYKKTTLLNICFNGCKKATLKEMKDYIKKRMENSFGKDGNELYIMNKTVFNSLYKNINNLRGVRLENAC